MTTPSEEQKQMLVLIEEETSRIQYGKVIIEITVMKGKATNIQAETKRSVNLNAVPEKREKMHEFTTRT